jgi:HlyD family secretion protein
MDDNKQIFRKVALERLSSPEQIDMLMRVTSPKGWVALLALCGLVAAAIGWGIFGSIPTKVNGTCILIRPGGVRELVAPGGGRVVDISVDVGDSVREGQMVARIEHYDALEQIKNIKARLYELKSQEARLKTINALEAKQQSAYLSASKNILNNRIRTGQEHLQALEAKIHGQAQLVEQGLITRQTWLSTKLDYANAKQDVENNRNEILKIDMNRTDSQKQIQNELESTSIQIHDAERNLASQMRSAKESSLVYSPYNGRVLELRVSENELASAGTPILSIEQTGASVNDLEAHIYIAPIDGKKIRANMDVQVSPSTAKREEFGVMLGKVREVGKFPSTAQGMMRSLKNEELVKELAAGAAPIEVQSDLIPSAQTVSGYKWSSPKGPESRIESGTMCSATITVKQQRPISLVIPIMRENVGI